MDSQATGSDVTCYKGHPLDVYAYHQAILGSRLTKATDYAWNGKSDNACTYDISKSTLLDVGKTSILAANSDSDVLHT
jgi:hypothetical protein